MKKIGEIIREHREIEGLLIRQLAALLDIDTAILSKIERGERKATRNQISKIAEILKLDKNNLLIQYLSENIAYEIANEECASKVLEVTEQKIKYLKSNFVKN